MAKITFNLYLPSWMAQWFANRCGGGSPLRMPKGSMESIIVQRFTVRKSQSLPDLPMPDCLVIEIPENKAKPAEIYCHLPESAKKLLAKSISDQFNLCLAEDIITPMFPLQLKKNLIYSWMDKNKIEPTEQNWLGIEKRFSRLRAAMLASRRVKRSRKKSSE